MRKSIWSRFVESVQRDRPTELDVLSQALELLGENGERWTKGALREPNYELGGVNYCAIGAVEASAGQLKASIEVRDAVIMRLSDQILPPNIDDTFAAKRRTIMTRNDRMITTFADIKGMFCRAMKTVAAESENEGRGSAA